MLVFPKSPEIHKIDGHKLRLLRQLYNIGMQVMVSDCQIILPFHTLKLSGVEGAVQLLLLQELLCHRNIDHSNSILNTFGENLDFPFPLR